LSHHGGGVFPGHELIEGGAAVAGGEALEGVGKPDARIDAVELGCLDQSGDDGPVVAAIVRSGEEGVLAVESERADRSLDGVGVDLDAAIVEEAAEPGPAAERIADRVGELALLA
jgi:hypothetical protein